MTDRELNIALREMARAQGLCDEWYAEWSDDSTIDECLERAIRGFDFVQEKDYPPLDFIRKHFEKEALHRHGMYLDEDVDIEADSGYYAFLGHCTAKVVVDGFKAVSIYVRHDSRVDVDAFNGAKVFVTYYDESDGDCRNDGWSKCRKYERKRG